jgi:hypothetical protein
METLVDKKLARSIGVSNFSAQLLMDLLRYARVRPATLQIEHHPYLTQSRLVNYAQEQGIAVTAYSSFGPLSFLELDLKHAKDTPLLFEHATIKAIAEKHGRTPAQVLLRWSTQRKIAVIPKSNDPTRLAQNLQVTDFDLEASEIEAISALDKGLRFNDPMAVSFLSVVDCLLAMTDFLLVRPWNPHFLSASRQKAWALGDGEDVVSGEAILYITILIQNKRIKNILSFNLQLCFILAVASSSLNIYVHTTLYRS